MSAQTLPLFPLNTVLFPRMPLSLSIFEERYKRMLTRCLKEERPFGVVLIKEGLEVGGPSVTENVGTIARIHAIEPLEDGRFNLFTEGTTRFRIKEIDRESEPYLVGRVALVRDSPNGSDLAPLAQQMRARFREYFDILINYAGVDMPEYELPDSPEELSFVMAAVVQADVSERQSFLETTSTEDRLQRLSALLIADIERVRRAADRAEPNAILAQRLPSAWRDKFVTRN